MYKLSAQDKHQKAFHHQPIGTAVCCLHRDVVQIRNVVRCLARVLRKEGSTVRVCHLHRRGEERVATHARPSHCTSPPRPSNDQCLRRRCQCPRASLPLLPKHRLGHMPQLAGGAVGTKALQKARTRRRPGRVLHVQVCTVLVGAHALRQRELMGTFVAKDSRSHRRRG